MVFSVHVVVLLMGNGGVMNTPSYPSPFHAHSRRLCISPVGGGGTRFRREFWAPKWSSFFIAYRCMLSRHGAR